MKFDCIVGNPPYQQETDSQSTRMPPIYNYFMDFTYEHSDCSVLVTPARFLFDAGWTNSDWNKQMLNDEHFKVLYYEQDSEDFFPRTDIKGGVAITYHDAVKEFEPVKIFTAFNELNSIVRKVVNKNGEKPCIDSIAYPALSYGLTDLMREENPNAVDRLRTNAFDNLSEIFFDEKPKDGNEYMQMIGLQNQKRVFKWVRSDYISKQDNFDSFKVILPKSNGSGALGEVLSTPLIGRPLIGHTQTFMSLGCFKTETECENCLKYIKSKFARCMLGVYKVTQDNPPEKWRLVPLQDFTPQSDIDWTASVSDIDRQFYAKYTLDSHEVAFIEEKVKAMM